MPATNSKPTPEELDQANQIHDDVNDYLEYLSELIQSKVDSEDSDEEIPELSPIVSQFLQEYKEYVASSQTQLFDSDSLGPSIKSKKSSRLPKRFLKYSKTYQALQLLSPDLLCDQKLCETKLDYDVQVSPSFSTFFDNDRGENERLLTNGSPSVSLLKAQLEKDAREREKNYIIVRSPIYAPVEEKKFIFVVKKSTDVIAAAPPPAAELPQQEQQEPLPVIEEINDSTIDEKLSGKKTKKSAIDRDLLSSFLTIAKVGFSRSQLSQLSQLCKVNWP